MIRQSLNKCKTIRGGCSPWKNMYNIELVSAKNIHNIIRLRHFSTKPNENHKIQSSKKKQKSFFLTWKCFAVNLAMTLPILYFYILEDQKRKNRKHKTTVSSIGKPLIGGDFTLFNQHGEIVTNASFKNKFCLIYFGFSYCPDICPQELEKQTMVIEKLHQKYGNDIIAPIFISVDPKRDTVAQIYYYCKSFSDKLIGLTGTNEMIKHVTKGFRVYFNENVSSTNSSKEESPQNTKYNYLIDHSIIHYLIDTNGQFVDFYGKNVTVNEMVEKISEHLDEFIKNRKVNQTSQVIQLHNE